MTRPVIAAFLLAVDPDGRWLVMRDDASPKGCRLPGGAVAGHELPAAVALRHATVQTRMPLTAGTVIFLRCLADADCLIHIYQSIIPSFARRVDRGFGDDGGPSPILLLDPADASRFLRPVIGDQLLRLHFNGRLRDALPRPRWSDIGCTALPDSPGG